MPSTRFLHSSDVVGLDPLEADDFFRNLPGYNASQEVAPMLRFLEEAPSRLQALELSRPVAAATLRDLGMTMASLRRHGLEPVEQTPSIEPWLLKLGEITEMVPRDTVAHYGPWNPVGHRERRYCGDEKEGRLIEAVREGIPLVVRMSRELLDALGGEPFSEEFEAELNAARATAERLVSILGMVQASVTPWFFAREIRPYFEAVVVGGQSYQGAAAAQMPLYIVDVCLWGPESAEFQELMEMSILHATPTWRELLGEAMHVPRSLASLVVEHLDSSPTPAVLKCADTLRRLFRALVTFRGRHAALAKAAYDAETGLYEKGSGGGTPIQLLSIVRAMHDAGQEIARASLQTAKHRECPYSAVGPLSMPLPPERPDRQTCVQALRLMYSSRGDAAVQALDPVLSPDFVFHPAGKASSIQDVYQGPEGMKDFLRRQSDWTADTWWPEVKDLTIGEQYIIAVVEVKPSRASDAKEESFQILHRWEIQNGFLVEFRSFVHDQERYDRFHTSGDT